MTHGASFVLIAALIGFSLYRRIRRTVAFQPLKTKRLIVRMILLCVVAGMYLLGLLRYPQHLPYALLGLLAGAVLTYFAIRTTEFEQRGERLFYRPNVWIGTFLIVLFVGRLANRIFEIERQVHSRIAAGQQMYGQPYGTGSDPFIAVFWFTLVAYYVGYSIFLIRHQKRLRGSSNAETREHQNDKNR